MPIRRFLTSYNIWSHRSPLLSQTIVATITTAFADILIQKTERKTFNPQRTLGFAFFGFSYVGLAQYAIYVYGYQRIFCEKVINRFCNAPWREKIRDKEGLKVLGKQMVSTNISLILININ